jgi:hypothetical protein
MELPTEDRPVKPGRTIARPAVDDASIKYGGGGEDEAETLDEAA